ncbi:MAG: HAMP domain-containing sensor histidine kinase [Rikenellaceae bacterium]
MATAFTNKLSRQGHIFAVTLILLWILVISFVGLRFWLLIGSDDGSTTPEDLVLFDEVFFVVAFFITLFISIIGVIVARLYTSLGETALQVEHEHNVAREQEQEKIRIKRQLTNNINHELKTPICSILGYLEMILGAESLDEKTVRSFVQKSYDQAERLRRLMFDLSTITRIDEASVMIDREFVDLSLLVENVVDDVAVQAERQNIEIVNRVGQKVTMNGNHSLLYSVFRNLIDNAIAYSGGRRVEILIDGDSETHYNFVIRDNGIGVESQHLPHLFERFYRIDKGRSRKAGGTGLGLSIVKNAVLFHGGAIVARRVRSGGLEFAFSLAKRPS